MEENIRLKRLKYRSWHRGCKETDLILGNFAEDRLVTLDEQTLSLYERLLDENDVDIWNWLSGSDTPADASYQPLLEMLKNHALDITQ